MASMSVLQILQQSQQQLEYATESDDYYQGVGLGIDLNDMDSNMFELNEEAVSLLGAVVAGGMVTYEVITDQFEA